MAFGIAVNIQTDATANPGRGDRNSLVNRLETWGDADADREIVWYRYHEVDQTFHVVARLTNQTEADLDAGLDTVADLVDGNLDTVVPFQHEDRTDLKETFMDVEGGF